MKVDFIGFRYKKILKSARFICVFVLSTAGGNRLTYGKKGCGWQVADFSLYLPWQKAL
jgi:hypothetical protein